MPPDVPRVPTWDNVRRLYVQTVGPVLSAAGFGPAGRTMWRTRGEFVDVIDCRCNKWNTAAQISFGCGLRHFTKLHPKPWHCIFNVQGGFPWPAELLEFKESAELQLAAFRKLAPKVLQASECWFAHFSDLPTAREAAKSNSLQWPNRVALFGVPSPAFSEAMEQLNLRTKDIT